MTITVALTEDEAVTTAAALRVTLRLMAVTEPPTSVDPDVAIAVAALHEVRRKVMDAIAAAPWTRPGVPANAPGAGPAILGDINHPTGA